MRRTLVTLMGAGLLVLGMAPAGAAAEVDRRPMMWHMQSGNPHGSLVGATANAQLVRTERGISFSIQTEQLIAGHAYTIWIVVVNDPSACTVTPCPPPEILGNPDTDGQVTYGTGHVVGSAGEAGFGGFLQQGPIPQGWLPNQGLDDPLGAEIHLVLNDHGPVLDGYLPEMIQTYRAGCTDASLPAIFPASARADGTPGPNACQLRQFVVFG